MYIMRSIGIRELRVNITSELDDLPFQITKNNKPIAVVMDIIKTNKQAKTAVTPTSIPNNFCKHGRPAHLCTDRKCRKT